MTIDQKVYTPGDFVYYDVPENKRKSASRTMRIVRNKLPNFFFLFNSIKLARSAGSHLH